jgi:chemotaxis protein methyltransferase WspC
MPRRTVESLLADRIGVDPRTLGEGQLTRALHARMSDLGLSRPEDYARTLRGSAEEQDALVEAVVVTESWFFRDERPFEVFREYVRERWLSRPDLPPLRVLSVPCAGGEEPYSVAIALLELGLPRERWVVDAVDVSARMLEHAARGVFRENSFRGADLAFRARHFREVGRGYELDPRVRAGVRFLRGNLLDPNLLTGEPPYDVIFCRNLLIYFDPAARRRALDTLERLLAGDGLLFLGHAELPGEAASRFESFGGKGAFAYRRAAATPAELPQDTGPAARGMLLPRRPPKERLGRHTAMSTREPAPTAAHERRNPDPPKPPAAPTPPPPEAVSPGPVRLTPLLDEAAELAGRGRNDEAAALCERSLREQGPTAQAFFLLGMIRQAAGDARQAEACLQKTAYLDPGHDDALLALAVIAERRGDAASAAGYRRRAARAHRKRGTP